MLPNQEFDANAGHIDLKMMCFNDIPFRFHRIIVVSLEQDMINFPLEATAIFIISAECLTGKSNSPVTEAPDPSFFLFTLKTRIVFPFAKAVMKALK